MKVDICPVYLFWVPKIYYGPVPVKCTYLNLPLIHLMIIKLIPNLIKKRMAVIFLPEMFTKSLYNHFQCRYMV